MIGAAERLDNPADRNNIVSTGIRRRHLDHRPSARSTWREAMDFALGMFGALCVALSIYMLNSRIGDNSRAPEGKRLG